MTFTDTSPIYRQIADYCAQCILSGMWQPAQRIPSVRELAVQLTVNTHTVLKAFDLLQEQTIIEPRRGMGYFLATDARARVLHMRKQEFLTAKLPQVFAEMKMIGVDINEIVEQWKNH